MWAALQPVGRDARTGGYRRFAWTREDHDLREWFAGECAARGLDLTEDRMGNQWAWWGDPDAAAARGRKGVVTGSHLDSVPDGGAFDGPLGVVSALAAIDVLRAKSEAGGWQPLRPIGIVNFVDEEGARFGVACAGSRVITGVLGADRARGLKDAAGTTMAEALSRAGRDPELIGPDHDTLERIGSFVELHVEQGRALVDLGRPVAVGTDIWPHGRWRLDFPGEANHAGTTRLEDRRDAMLGYAQAVLTARSAARAHGCLATVGKVVVQPGGVNAIPSAVTGWLDARGADEQAVRAAVAQVAGEAARAGATVTEESWTPTTPFDADLASRLQRTLAAAQQTQPHGIPLLGTGAGHDAGILANAGIPAAMLFVRNPTGISHSPEEWAEADDCQAGVRALAAVLEDLSGESS
jgi:N-carbamoyl-L-amino-acid hydrolase